MNKETELQAKNRFIWTFSAFSKATVYRVFSQKTKAHLKVQFHLINKYNTISHHLPNVSPKSTTTLCLFFSANSWAGKSLVWFSDTGLLTCFTHFTLSAIFGGCVLRTAPHELKATSSWTDLKVVVDSQRDWQRWQRFQVTKGYC